MIDSQNQKKTTNHCVHYSPQCGKWGYSLMIYGGKIKRTLAVYDTRKAAETAAEKDREGIFENI